MICEGGERMTNHEINNLIKKIALGDMAALETLYKGMSKPVYFYALRLTGNPDTAEDVMQDTFISIMRSSASFRAGEKGSSWIFTIAKNKAIDLSRRNRVSLSIDKAENIADKTEYINRSDDRLTALKMLDSLNKKERDIVMLRLFGDMTLTQTAKELNLPKGTVFWTYSNAIKKLGKIYSGGEQNEK